MTCRAQAHPYTRVLDSLSADLTARVLDLRAALNDLARPGYMGETDRLAACARVSAAIDGIAQLTGRDEGGV